MIVCVTFHVITTKKVLGKVKDETSEMIHHLGASLSEQQTADLLICHGTQEDLSLSTI